MGAKSSNDEGNSLRYTPTWEVALVCLFVVGVSLLLERLIHWLGKTLKKNNKNLLYEALDKVKEELMLLGFLSLLLIGLKDEISKIKIYSHSFYDKFLPCKEDIYTIKAKKGNKVAFMSINAFNGVHKFIFVLAVVHVVFSASTILLGIFKIHQWKHWEDSALRDESDLEKAQNKVTDVCQDPFMKNRKIGFGGKFSTLRGWLQSFFKQFHGSVTKSDYETLRRSFIMIRCGGNLKFNFHKYLISALEADFKKVVGMSWKLWIFVVLFLLVNIHGWNAYFWLSFVPLILSLVLGTKLEHIITQLAQKVANKSSAVIGDVLVQLSDEHFWFSRPHIILSLIHFVLFQNAFEMAIFIWMWIRYGFTSCIMGDVHYTIARLVVGVFVQVLNSFSTLPIYAFVTQTGSSFNKEVLDEHLQIALASGPETARKNVNGGTPHESSPAGIQVGNSG